MAMAVVFLIVSLLAAPAVYAVDHVVGDNSGWTQSVNYKSWASRKTFTVGDNLVFNYISSSHSVDVVGKPDYDSCTTGNALNSYSGGSSTVPLKKAGPSYFMCPSFGHCGGGMKLDITVVAASTTPTTPTTPSPPSGSTPPVANTPPGTPRSGTPPKSETSPPSPKPSGAAGNFSNMSQLVLGICLILASVFAFMG